MEMNHSLKWMFFLKLKSIIFIYFYQSNKNWNVVEFRNQAKQDQSDIR